MPTYQYNGMAGYYYPSLGATPLPGEHFVLPGAPDGNWSEVAAAGSDVQPSVNLAETDPDLGVTPVASGPDVETPAQVAADQAAVAANSAGAVAAADTTEAS